MNDPERPARAPRERSLAVLGLVVVAVPTLVGVGVFMVRSTARARALPSRPTTSSTTTTTTTTPPPPPAVVGQYSRLVAEENRKPGTAAWRLTFEGKPADIEGFANMTSVQQGEPVTLFVSTVAPTFTVEAYRMGWYQGLGGRLVWTSAATPGVRQAGPSIVSPGSMAEARWQPSLVVAPDVQWSPGDYLLKLVASTGQQRFVPLTIRDDTSTAAYVVMNAVSSWQAYNKWGGCSLYACTNGKGSRSRVVSYDRPYDVTTGGAGDFIGNELPLVMRMEEAAFDVTYITSVDLHRHPDLVARHRALVSLGHDEYWSKTMFDGAQGARDAGVNLAFLGANAVYRQIRFEPSPLGPDRHEINYRTADDPIRKVDPSQVTVSFRQSPVNRPEAALIGEQYECNPVRADLVVTDPGSWIWAGTGVTEGQHLDIVVGSEYDRYVPGSGAPDNVEILAHSPVKCGGRSSYSDVTYYTAPSGAGVFATGTNYWVSKLEPPEFHASPYNPVIVTVTRNVLAAFGAGPAGRAHPSVPNWQDLRGIGTRSGND